MDNKAVPFYYGIFRDQVLAGQVPVSEELGLEMNRIDQKISNPLYYYDPRPVEAFIAFCEGEMTKTDGSSLELLFSFKLWGEQLFCWYYYAPKIVYENGAFVEKLVLKRLINKMYLIVARGAAKSVFASLVQAYILIVDGTTTHQITTAPTMRQAEEIMAPIRTALTRAPGPLFKFLTEPTNLKIAGSYKKLVSPTKKGIENFITNSIIEVRPMSIDKLQGLRPFLSTIDEWLSGNVRENVIGAIEQGATKLDDYIILATTSEGTVRNASGDDIKLELRKILQGEYIADNVSIWHYKLDDISEVSDPSMWVKAQPNIGLTVSFEAYQRDVERAQNSPSARNDILAKRFGLAMEGYTYYFTYEETLTHPRRSFDKMDCALGVDLSQGDDFCSFSFMFPLRDGGFGWKSLNFITERTLFALPPSMRTKYDEFLTEKSLIVLHGATLDMREVFERLDEHIVEKGYTIVCMGFDPYNSDAFVKYYTETYGVYGVEAVRQGVRTESVPLGEIKIMTEDRAIDFDQRINMYAMGNCMVMLDNNGNRKLYKRRYEHKIDPVSALLCAYVIYQRHADLFY